MFAHGPLTERLWLWGDIHLRTYESFEPSAFLVRPGLSLRALPSLFLTVGYGWTPAFRREEGRPWGDIEFVDEHRPWQQVLFAPSSKSGIAGQLRCRLEQRFRPDGGGTGHRLRTLVRAQAPLSGTGALLAVMWDELFFGLNDTEWGQRGGVDQNRAFAGVGWQVAPTRLRFELGYQNVRLMRPGADTVNHIAALNTFIGW